MRALVTTLMAVMMVAVGATSYATEDLLALTNADRSRNGLTLLADTSELAAYAQGRAEEMMRAQALSHTANLMVSVPNSLSSFVGENVGRGATLTEIQSAFMASPAHRANILRPGYAEAGVGVAWDGVEHFWVAVIFRQAPTEVAPPVAMAAPASDANDVPAAGAISSPPTTARRESAPAPRATMSPPTTAPQPPPPPSAPAPVEQSAALEREAGPRLNWALEATTGEPVLRPDAPNGDSGAHLVAASTAAEVGSSWLLMALSLLGVVYASTRLLGETHRRLVSRLRS